MAEKLVEYGFRQGRPKGLSTSRYDQYLDGQIWEITLDDFPGVTSLQNIRTALVNRSKLKGMKVRTSSLRDALIVQAYTPDEEASV